MTPRLVIALETGLAGLAQRIDRDASVLVQFAAGHLQEIEQALAEAKALVPAAPTPVLASSSEAPKPGIELAPVPEAPAGTNVGDGSASAGGTTVPGEQPPA